MLFSLFIWWFSVSWWSTKFSFWYIKKYFSSEESILPSSSISSIPDENITFLPPWEYEFNLKYISFFDEFKLIFSILLSFSCVNSTLWIILLLELYIKFNILLDLLMEELLLLLSEFLLSLLNYWIFWNSFLFFFSKV